MVVGPGVRDGRRPCGQGWFGGPFKPQVSVKSDTGDNDEEKETE